MRGYTKIIRTHLSPYVRLLCSARLVNALSVYNGSDISAMIFIAVRVGSVNRQSFLRTYPGVSGMDLAGSSSLETSPPGSMSSPDCGHVTVKVTIPRPAEENSLGADLRGADRGEVALGKFAMGGDGAVKVVGQLEIVIADAHFELHRCWKRGLVCWQQLRVDFALVSTSSHQM